MPGAFCGLFRLTKAIPECKKNSVSRKADASPGTRSEGRGPHPYKSRPNMSCPVPPSARLPTPDQPSLRFSATRLINIALVRRPPTPAPPLCHHPPCPRLPSRPARKAPPASRVAASGAAPEADAPCRGPPGSRRSCPGCPDTPSAKLGGPPLRMPGLRCPAPGCLGPVTALLPASRSRRAAARSRLPFRLAVRSVADITTVGSGEPDCPRTPSDYKCYIVSRQVPPARSYGRNWLGESFSIRAGLEKMIEH
jgi:hypothetical protein